jgi:anaphase-promoting complex subunit 11
MLTARLLASTQTPFALAGDDVCGICRMPFDGCPPDGKYPGDDSPVVWGICTHAFHLQCINRWLQSQTEQKCPFCRRQWEFKQAVVGGEDESEDGAGT